MIQGYDKPRNLPDTVIDEASDRANGRVRCLEEYLKLTQPSAGGNQPFLTAEVDLHISNKVMEHTALQSILDFDRRISCPHKRGYFFKIDGWSDRDS